MAPLVQTADPGRFFQNAPARFGLGVDQLGDLPLPDQSGRVRAGGRIRKQHLHVARTNILAVCLVCAADIPGDPTHDFNTVTVIEPCGRKTVGIVHVQRHFGKVACRTCRSTGKDHVFHTAATHRGGAVFAHHPPQGFQQVGLSAAVGADNAGQTV